MQIETLISDLGNKLGISELKLDENNCCSLFVNENIINIQWQKIDDCLLIYSPIAIGLDKFSPELYEHLLCANLFGADTKNMHIGLHLPASALVLSKTMPIEESQNLLDFLNFFENEISRWQKNIANFKMENPEKQENSEQEMFYMKV